MPTGLDAGNLAAGSDSFQDAARRATLAADPRQVPLTLTEDDYLGLLGLLDGVTRPPGFRCTAVDTETGELVVGASIQGCRSCAVAVPMLFPTVTIGGVHYLDGDIVSRLNVPAARPADVVVVVSCQPLSGTDATEVDKLRGSARVVTVEPHFRGFDTPIRDPATHRPGSPARQAPGGSRRGRAACAR